MKKFTNTPSNVMIYIAVGWIWIEWNGYTLIVNLWKSSSKLYRLKIGVINADHFSKHASHAANQTLYRITKQNRMLLIIFSSSSPNFHTLPKKKNNNNINEQKYLQWSERESPRDEDGEEKKLHWAWNEWIQSKTRSFMLQLRWKLTGVHDSCSLLYFINQFEWFVFWPLLNLLASQYLTIANYKRFQTCFEPYFVCVLLL